MENSSLCPHCHVPLVPFNLLEDDARYCIVFSGVKLEDGLKQSGLRCSGRFRHEFGFIGERRVEIDCKFSREFVDPPNPSTKERIINDLVMFVFRWLNWAPLPKRTWRFLRDQTFVPWQVAETWLVAYDPNEPWMSEEEEALVRADIEADRMGEEGPEEPEDNFISPYADIDGGWEEDWERRQEEEDAQYAEDNSPEAWAEHRADEEDRDHGTYFPEEDDDGRWHDGWDDDTDDWGDEGEIEPEPFEK